MEWRASEHPHGVLSDHVFARDDLQQRGLSRAIRSNEQAAASTRKVQVAALNEGLAAGVRKCCGVKDDCLVPARRRRIVSCDGHFLKPR